MDNMVLVYRIEDPNTGLGPFQSSITGLETAGRTLMYDLSYQAGRHPELAFPGADGLRIGHIPHSYVFGCLSREWLQKWFLCGDTPDQNRHILERLEALGFVMVEALVPADAIRHGYSGCQVAFDRDLVLEQELFEHWSPLELLSDEDALERK